MVVRNKEVPDATVADAIMLLFCDIIIYAILAGYFEILIDGKAGRRYSFWYICSPSFWRSKPPFRDAGDAYNLDTYEEENSDIETVTEELKTKRAITLSNVAKIFPDNTFAIQELNFNIYEGQITGILGHNGAGKTTLINMLVGNLYPTSGYITVYNLNTTQPNDITTIRSMLGVCPQENILLDELTVRDHLLFFAEIKGVPAQEAETKVS